MRDRLIKLISEAYEYITRNGFIFNTDIMCDYLLTNKVTIPFCEVGDILYSIENCINRPEKIFVTAIHQYEKHITVTALSRSRKEYNYEKEDFGKYVFFSKEEAIKTLKRS